MTVEERERRHLQEALVHTLGPEPTDTLMAYLPPVGWADVATKHDLVTLQTVLRADMAATEERLRRELTEQVSGLRGEISGLRDELHGEIGSLRNWVHDELRTQFYWTITLFVLLLGAYTAALELI